MRSAYRSPATLKQDKRDGDHLAAAYAERCEDCKHLESQHALEDGDCRADTGIHNLPRKCNVEGCECVDYSWVPF